MQGYFSYTLFGNKDELIQAEEKIKELAKTDEDFKCLNYFNGGINENKYSCIEDSSNYSDVSLCYGMDESGNVNSIPFLFEDMMDKLSREFKDLEIAGEGYFLDFAPWPNWHSKKGSSDFTESFDRLSQEIYSKKSKMLDENGHFKVKSFKFWCSQCDHEVDIPIDEDEMEIEDFGDPNGDLYCDFEYECPHCNVTYDVSLVLSED